LLEKQWAERECAGAALIQCALRCFLNQPIDVRGIMQNTKGSNAQEKEMSMERDGVGNGK